MRKLISDDGGYKTFIDIAPIDSKLYNGWANFRVVTVWEEARSTVEEHTKFQMNLNPDALKNLKEILNEY